MTFLSAEGIMSKLIRGELSDYSRIKKKTLVSSVVVCIFGFRTGFDLEIP
jgi:hypothetical protein